MVQRYDEHLRACDETWEAAGFALANCDAYEAAANWMAVWDWLRNLVR